MYTYKLALAACSLSLATPALAHQCKRVRADIETTITAEGCTSPVGLCTTGVISKSTLISGTTTFVGEALGGGAVGEPSIVTPPVEPDTTWTYAGTLVVTGEEGTLTLEDVGVYDTVGRPYSEFQRIIDGTGIFEGASGVLFSYGWAKKNGSGFKGRVRGKVCWDSWFFGDETDNQSDDDVALLSEDGDQD